jgi:hypothetical protein
MALPRVFISTDLRLSSEEQDDAQSLIHALLYQDEMNIVGIAGTASQQGHQDGLVGDIDKIIDVYAQDYATLEARSSAFKSPEELKALTWQGATDTAPWQGYSQPTDSSEAIIAEAHKAAEAGEVLNVLTWGGETDLAQALHDDPSIAPHIRFFNINDQDPNAYNYIKANFKGELDMWVDDQSTFRGMYQTPTSSGIIPDWHEENAAGHGALGDLFADLSGDIFNEAGVKMGDSPTVLRFLSGNQDDPSQESWGGEFVQVSPGYWTDSTSDSLDLDRPNTDGAYTIYEDRDAWMDDFAERLDWLEEDAPSPPPPPSQPPPPAPPASPPPSSGSNLLVNGSFEASSVPTGQYASYASVPGWTALSGGRIELWNAHRGVTATDGADFAELDYQGARDGFYQDVNAAAGQSYTLSFDLRARPGASVSSQAVEVVWNGQVVATATPGAQWSTFSTTVTGTSALDRLTIREVGSQGGDGHGALLDDFSLVPTGSAPTPPTPTPPTGGSGGPGGSGPDTVTVRVSGDAWEGDPNFALTVNGRVVDATNVVTADHNEGEWDTLVFKGDFDLDGSDRVGVQFTNDHYEGSSSRDRNLYVDSVTLNGETNGRDQAFFRGDTAHWDF